MTKEGKKVNPLLIVTIVLGFLVIVLGTSTTVLLLKKSSNTNNNDTGEDTKKGDISGDLTVKLAKKVDNSKSFIFDSEGKVGNSKNNNFPVINIDTSSVKKVNENIERKYLEKIEKYENYAYFYIIYNKYLSVVCYYMDGSIPVVDIAFVIDLTTGLAFDNMDLLEIFGYKDEEIPEKAVEKAFSEFDKDLDSIIKKYPNMYEEQQNEILIITNDTLNGRFYFVDESGRLYQIYTYGTFGDKGLSGDFKTIDLSDYSLAIYKINE